MDCMHAGHKTLGPWKYGQGRVSCPCPKLRQSGHTGRVDYAIAELVPAVLLPSSHPHDGFSRKGCGGRIPCVPVECLSYLRVPRDMGVDVRVVVGLGWSRRVEGDVRRCLVHVSHELVARLPFTSCRLQIKNKMSSKHAEFSVRNNEKVNSRTKTS